MIIRATITDLDFIKIIMDHPKINPYLYDDLAKNTRFDLSILLKIETIYFLIGINEINEKIGIFVGHPWNSICYEAHTLILPEFRGEETVKIAKEAIRWMFDNTLCKKIVTHVPTFNQKAYALAIKVGGKLEGINKKSFLKFNKLYDQYLFGFIKED